MNKITLKNIDQLSANESKALQVINENYAKISTAIEKCLFRDGTIPSYMLKELDMNSNKIINLPAPTGERDAVRLKELQDYITKYNQLISRIENIIPAAELALRLLVEEELLPELEAFDGQAEAFANLSKDWAIKTNGTVIDENGQDTGEYSAKHYANQSLVSEQNASTSEQNASTSEQNANDDAIIAANSATLAQEWAAKAATEASKAIGLEIGSLISSSLPILNAVKYVLADGTQYSTTGVYQAFADYLAQVKLTHPQCFVTQAEFDADVASTGQCGRYVLDTVNFRVPKITRYVGATINLADIGKAWSESLPNITGFTGYGDQHSFESGAFSTGTSGTSTLFSGTITGPRAYFNASLSSSTYQDNAKVNPERVTYPYYIVVSNAGQMTPVEIDINNVLTDLALKADKDLDNVTANIDFVVESYNGGQNWYRVYKSGWIEQGGITNFSGTNGITTFLKPFKSSNYTIVITLGLQTDTAIYGSEVSAWNRTNTGFTTRSANKLWFACGQGA